MRRLRQRESSAAASAPPILIEYNSTRCGRTLRKLPRHRSWPHLLNLTQVLRFGSGGFPPHLHSIEPLSVHAFLSAIARAPSGSAVIDIGANVGAYTTLAAALGAHVLAVEMQPKCKKIIECNLLTNSLSSRADVQLAYAASGAGNFSTSIAVPDDECGVMVSPSAVGGRFPHGRLQRKTRILLGTDNRTEFLSKTMQMVPVPPLFLGRYYESSFYRSGRRRIAAVKIDVEGFEVAVLESLRPIWHLLGDMVLELQPNAWQYAGVTAADGLRTLRELIKMRSYSVVTLPHRHRNDTDPNIAAWDACNVPVAGPDVRLAPGNGGLRTSLRFGYAGLEAYIQRVLNHARAVGYFSEILLTRRCGSRSDHVGRDASSGTPARGAPPTNT